MSTGKRLAKRSIIGTRVCVRAEDGFYYPGVIDSVKTPADNPTAPPSQTRYTVRFDRPAGAGLNSKREFRHSELIGSGFGTIHGVRLLPAQKVYITYNGREISGRVVVHRVLPDDEVVVSVLPPGAEGDVEVRKRLEEVRLTECRKSARLQDHQDTDYSRLADMACDRKRLSSHYIDVPQGSPEGDSSVSMSDADVQTASPKHRRRNVGKIAKNRPHPWRKSSRSRSRSRSRKRRPSTGQDENKEDLMDECTAALVLMRLSCSPHSPNSWMEPLSPEASLSDTCSGRSNTPSPPLSEGAATNNWLSASDEGIVLDDDFDELPKKKKALLEIGSGWQAAENSLEGDPINDKILHDPYTIANKMVYQCTWPKCNVRTMSCPEIETHVRRAHLGPRMEDEGMEGDDHEEEFYYTEVEFSMTSPPPTLSHRDMARPPHEDPEYQKSLGLNRPISSFSWPISSALSPGQKQMKLSVSAPSGKFPGSPSRRIRGDTKKCRKVYGMEQRELWCTQCKWKKACTRFQQVII